MHAISDADPLVPHMERKALVTVLTVDIVATPLDDDVNTFRRKGILSITPSQNTIQLLLDIPHDITQTLAPSHYHGTSIHSDVLGHLLPERRLHRALVGDTAAFTGNEG